MPKTAEIAGSKFKAWLAPRGMAGYAAIFIFINVLFVLRYGGRASLNPAWAGLGYAVFFAAQLVVAAGISRWVSNRRYSWKWPVLLAAVYLAAALAVYLRMDPEHLQIDRWSALDHFWGAFFRGEYPYRAQTHLDHPISGFPGLMLLALPFYGMGDVGYLQFFALAAFAALLIVRLRDGARPLYLFSLLILMPVFEYQVFCRSDLWGNMVAVAWLLHLGGRSGAARGGRLWLWAIAWGLLLSTRGIVLIPLILAAGGLLKGRGWRAGAGFFIVAGTVCLATFLPFYLWDPVLFRVHNPYAVQAGYISRPVLAAILAFTAALAYRYRAAPRVYLHAGLILFGTIFLCWLLKALEKGWGAVVWSPFFDISYFVVAIPFLLPALGESLPASSPAFAAGAEERR